ncbi:MAG: hypothetical protein L3J39_14575 [Verrucomicrobiales bacterium]|nr:hypothetical protein [Verrucomicrobiales bacterium]
MKSYRYAWLNRLILMGLLVCMISSCQHVSMKLPALKVPKMPSFFGAKKEKKKAASEALAASKVPGNKEAGVVHLVNDRGRFVLVKSMSGGRPKVSAGTTWMSYDPSGRPSAKLKVSEERKGVFVVADIIEGFPSRGDSVVLHGVMDRKGEITTVTGPDGKEKQILE